MKKILDITKSPLVAVWETTQTCDAAFCRETGQPERDPLELTTKEAEKLIRDVGELRPPVFVFAGGNPLERDDIFGLVRYAASCHLHATMVLSASPLLTRMAVAELKNAGLSRLGLTLDGASAAVHDTASGKPGSFNQTLEAIRWANEWRLPVQIHTALTRHNLADLDDIAALLKKHRVLMWSVVFPVPSDQVRPEDVFSGQEFEETFARLYHLAQQVPFKIKAVEAQHYRRFVLQEKARERADKVWGREQSFADNGIPGILPINENRASLYITSTGEVYPDACLPVSAGNVRLEKLAEIYRNSELFQSLRDVSKLTGKCGRCSFKEICGGSRARAFAMFGDMYTQDSHCVYEPPAPAGAEVTGAEQ